MKKVITLAIAVTILEVWAFIVFRDHPLIRPEWFSNLLLAIQLLMCLGGIHGCRWLLRLSPVARLEAPERDWTKLWLWCGPIGGVLMVKACLLGWLATDLTGALFLGLVVAAHGVGGAVLWTICLPWAVVDMFKDKSIGFRERLLMQVGIASHAIGYAVFFGFFPGNQIPPITLLGAVYFFGFNLYYLMMVAISWGIIFRFWKPRALSDAEQVINKSLDSPEEYETE